MCLWEILQLASVRPFADKSDGDVLASLADLRAEDNGGLQLERPPLCPKDLFELMCECWRKEPEDRPSFREIHLFLQRKNLGYSPLV